MGDNKIGDNKNRDKKLEIKIGDKKLEITNLEIKLAITKLKTKIRDQQIGDKKWRYKNWR